jgi:hypothetical protein
MSDRGRRILAGVALAAALAMLVYMAVVVVLIALGDLAPGPVRLATLVLNAATAVALLILVRLTLRSTPPPR